MGSPGARKRDVAIYNRIRTTGSRRGRGLYEPHGCVWLAVYPPHDVQASCGIVLKVWLPVLAHQARGAWQRVIGFKTPAGIAQLAIAVDL